MLRLNLILHEQLEAIGRAKKAQNADLFIDIVQNERNQNDSAVVQGTSKVQIGLEEPIEIKTTSAEPESIAITTREDNDISEPNESMIPTVQTNEKKSLSPVVNEICPANSAPIKSSIQSVQSSKKPEALNTPIPAVPTAVHTLPKDQEQKQLLPATLDHNSEKEKLELLYDAIESPTEQIDAKTTPSKPKSITDFNYCFNRVGAMRQTNSSPLASSSLSAKSTREKTSLLTDANKSPSPEIAAVPELIDNITDTQPQQQSHPIERALKKGMKSEVERLNDDILEMSYGSEILQLPESRKKKKPDVYSPENVCRKRASGGEKSDEKQPISDQKLTTSDKKTKISDKKPTATIDKKPPTSPRIPNSGASKGNMRFLKKSNTNPTPQSKVVDELKTKSKNFTLHKCRTGISMLCSRCRLETKDKRTFEKHLSTHKLIWSGFCGTCNKKVAGSSSSVQAELKHLWSHISNDQTVSSAVEIKSSQEHKMVQKAKSSTIKPQENKKRVMEQLTNDTIEDKLFPVEKKKKKLSSHPSTKTEKIQKVEEKMDDENSEMTGEDSQPLIIFHEPAAGLMITSVQSLHELDEDAMQEALGFKMASTK